MEDKLSIDTSEFLARFPDENSARIYMEGMRWKGRPACPCCGNSNHIDARMPFGTYKCINCRGQFTVKTGSVFDGRDIPLRTWLFAMFVIEKTSFAISDLWLAETIAVSRSTANYVLHRLRNIDSDSPLSGATASPVEVAEAEKLVA